MDLGLLHTFLTLSRLGHMTRAAKELHLTQPAVSAQIQRLEDEVGFALFDRTPKGMRLTEAGRVWGRYAEDVLAKVEEGRGALRALAGLERGTLTVGGGATATTYLLPRVLGEFHTAYPNIQLFVREQGSSGVLEAVVRGELELGIITLPGSLDLGSLTGLEGPEVGSLHLEPWVTDELRLIVPASHRLYSRRSIRWQALEQEPLILFEAGSAVRQIIDRALAGAGVKPQTVMELRSIESIKQMVAQGIGSAFVSTFALHRGERGLTLSNPQPTRRLGIIWRQDRQMSQAARTFVEMLRGVPRQTP